MSDLIVGSLDQKSYLIIAQDPRIETEHWPVTAEVFDRGGTNCLMIVRV